MATARCPGGAGPTTCTLAHSQGGSWKRLPAVPIPTHLQLLDVLVALLLQPLERTDGPARPWGEGGGKRGGSKVLEYEEEVAVVRGGGRRSSGHRKVTNAGGAALQMDTGIAVTGCLHSEVGRLYGRWHNSGVTACTGTCTGQ